MTEQRRFGPFTIDPGQRRLTRNGRVLSIQPKAFDLLDLLSARPGELLRRDELMSTLWPNVVVTDASLARCVKEVRQVLGDEAANPNYIETVPKAGFRFVAPVAAVSGNLSWQPHAMIWLGAALVLVAALVTSIWWWPSQGVQSSSGDQQQGPESGTDTTALIALRSFERGRVALSQRSPQSIKAAAEHFSRALEIDPRHAPSVAGLALANLLRHRHVDQEQERYIKSLAERALSIDPEQPWAHAVVGLLHLRRGNYPQARQDLEFAVARDPELVEAYVGLATLAANDGDLETAISWQRAGLSHDPGHATLGANMALNLGKRGRFEEALELVESFKEAAETRRAMVYPEWLVRKMAGDITRGVLVLLDGLEQWPSSIFMQRAMAEDLMAIGARDHALAMVAELDRNCEPVAYRLAGGARLRLSLGADALAVFDDLDVTQLAKEDPGLMSLWRGRRALHDGQYQLAASELLQVYPSPDAVAVVQGGLATPILQAQDLIFALQQSGQADLANLYLQRVDAIIDQRWQRGETGHNTLVAFRARNAAMMGDMDLALDELQRAVDLGWLDLTFVDQPHWGELIDRPDFVAIQERMLERAAAIQLALEGKGFGNRLSEAINRIPDARAADIRAAPQAMIDTIDEPGLLECVQSIRGE